MDSKAQDKNRRSFLFKLLVPLLALNILATLIFIGSIFAGGAIKELQHNSIDIFSNVVSMRKTYLQNQMNSHWAELDENMRDFEEVVSNVLKSYDASTFDKQSYTQPQTSGTTNNNSISDIGQNVEADGKDYLTEYLLKNVSSYLVKVLRQNYVNGAYFILEGNSDNEQKEGLYFRRTTNLNTTNNVDLTLLIAPTRANIDYCEDFGTKTNSKDRFDFNDELSANFAEIYEKVFSTAKTAAAQTIAHGGSIDASKFSKNYAYWAPVYSFLNVKDIISYNMPLVFEGEVYGVFGIDINISEIVTILNPLELMGGSSNGSYVFSVREANDDKLIRMTSSGVLINKLYTPAVKEIGILENVRGSCYRLADSGNTKSQIYASISQLQIYNTNSPYESTTWEIAGIVEKSELFSFSSDFTLSVFVSSFVGLALSISGIILLSIYLAHPIKRLFKEVRSHSSLTNGAFNTTKIIEIDELIEEIRRLAEDVKQSESRIEEIISIAGVPIAAFEHKEGLDSVFYTAKFFELLSVPHDTNTAGFLKSEDFYAMLSQADKYINEVSDDNNRVLYKTKTAQGSTRWVVMTKAKSAGRTLGVVSDITEELKEKEKLEYERDHDWATKLYNRRALYERAEKIFSHPERIETAAVIMIDLDDLKFVNDSYGHKVGDLYIDKLAEILRKYNSDRIVTSRYAGDEFVLIVRAESKDAIRRIVESIMKDVSKAELYVNGSEKKVISVCIGTAWYAQNDSFEQLLKKADEAMYLSKSRGKGCVTEYEPTAKKTRQRKTT